MVVLYSFHWEAEAGGTQVRGQSWLCNEILSQKAYDNNNINE